LLLSQSIHVSVSLKGRGSLRGTAQFRIRLSASTTEIRLNCAPTCVVHRCLLDGELIPPVTPVLSHSQSCPLPIASPRLSCRHAGGAHGTSSPSNGATVLPPSSDRTSSGTSREVRASTTVSWRSRCLLPSSRGLGHVQRTEAWPWTGRR
jgi:hypothetical protein